MFRVAGINFDHMHMGDLLRQVHDHPGAEISGICDADRGRMAGAIAAFDIPPAAVFTEVAACLATRPDMVILCPATAAHATCVAQVAGHTRLILLENPLPPTLPMSTA